MSGTTDPIAKRYYETGGKLFEANNFTDAIDCYSKALEWDPSYSSAFLNRSLAYALCQKYVEATNDAMKVIELEPDAADAPYIMGVISEYQGDFQGAREWYAKSLKNNPNYTKAKDRLERLLELAKEEIDSPHLALETNRLQSGVENPLQNVGETKIIEGQIRGLARFHPTKTLKDVIELEDVKEFLRINVVIPSIKPEVLERWKVGGGLSLMLYGPSGCGKTYLVESLAGEIGADLILLKLHEVVDMYSGNTEKNIHMVFQMARDLLVKGGAKQVIIFIDELDAIGLSRAIDVDASGRRAAVNQLLIELDGLEKNPKGLIVVGATNKPWDVDPALKRSGRFGDWLYIPPPSSAGRRNLFEYSLRDAPTTEIDYDKLAGLTNFYSPADIVRVTRAAKRLASAREAVSGKKVALTTDDLLAAIDHNKTGTLHHWFREVARETSSHLVDETEYKPFLDDISRALGTKRYMKNTVSRPKKRPAIAAYA